MKNIVAISEICQDDASNFLLVDYDTMPSDYKALVDKALTTKNKELVIETSPSFSYGGDVKLDILRKFPVDARIIGDITFIIE